MKWGYSEATELANLTSDGSEGSPRICRSAAESGHALPRPNAELRDKFQGLVKHWHVQRGVSSSVTGGVLCSAYQSIIGMGPPAVPLLLERLKSEGSDPDQWFWALSAITECQPVPEEDLGNFVTMARHWLNWGARNGYDP